MADSLKRWWQRRLCIKRARQLGSQEHHEQLRKKRQGLNQRKHTSASTCQQLASSVSQTVGTEDADRNMAVSASIAGSAVEEIEPQHPPPPPQPPPPRPLLQPPPLQISRTTFASVLPKVASRLHTIHEEEDGSRSQCARFSSEEEATAGANSANDCCPSDDLDSRDIFDSDHSELDRASLERQNRTRNNVQLEEIDHEFAPAVGEPEAEAQAQAEAEAEADHAAVDVVTLSEAFSTTMTRTGTATTTCSSPSPSIAPRRSPQTGRPWLQVPRCHRNSRHRGHFKASRGNCDETGGGGGGAEWPQVRLEKVSIRPLTLALGSCRSHCFETRGKSSRGHCGDFSDDESVEDYADNRRQRGCRQQSRSPEPSSEAVFGVACDLQSSDMDSTFPSSAAELANMLSGKCNGRSTNLSNVYGQPTAGLAANATPATTVKRQSSRITRIWLDVESSSSSRTAKEKKPSHRKTEKPEDKQELPQETESEDESDEKSEKPPSPPPAPTAAVSKKTEPEPENNIDERKNSLEKKIKVKRERKSSRNNVSEDEAPVFVYEATVPINSAGNVDEDIKTQDGISRAGGDTPHSKPPGQSDGHPSQQDKQPETDQLPRCCTCCCATVRCCCCHVQQAKTRPVEASSVGCEGCQHRCCSCCCHQQGCNRSPRGHACCHHQHSQHQHQRGHQPCGCSTGYANCCCGCCMGGNDCCWYQPPLRYINPHSSAQFDLAEPWIWQPPVSPSEHRQQLVNISEGQARNSIAEAEKLCKALSRRSLQEEQQPDKASDGFQQAAAQQAEPSATGACPISSSNLANWKRSPATKPSWLMTAASLTDRNSQATNLALLTSSGDLRMPTRNQPHPNSFSSSSGFRSSSQSSHSSARVTILSSREGEGLADSSGRYRISSSSSDVHYSRGRRR